MREAMYYEITGIGEVLCYLCPHFCRLADGQTGRCRARKNVEGKLFSMNYGKVASIALDPIEKKPLYHFFPGSTILSVGSFGCNLSCSFCQNWQIAHERPSTHVLTPEELVEISLEQDENCVGIAYTYNEPSIWFEYVLESAKIAQKFGLKNVLVTNGFINLQPLRDLVPYIDAMNIDVKGFTERYYSEVCEGTLKDVCKTVETAAASCHVEITTLVVPDLNDSIDEIIHLSRWLSDINPDIPLHLTRYFPNYKMQDRPPTPIKTLHRVRDEAEKYLKNVYLGNV